MKGLETILERLLDGRERRLKALTRYEGFGNIMKALACSTAQCVLKALTRYEGFGNLYTTTEPAMSLKLKALTRYEGFGNSASRRGHWNAQ